MDSPRSEGHSVISADSSPRKTLAMATARQSLTEQSSDSGNSSSHGFAFVRVIIYDFVGILSIVKEYMSDSFTNYNYVGNTKVSVSIKKTYIKRVISN